MERIEIFWEKTRDGGWAFSTIAKGRRIHMHYIGYTKKEALRRFREHVTKETSA